MSSYRILVVLFSALIALNACGNKPVAGSAIASESGYSDVEGVALVVKDPAPGFTLSTFDGKSISLSDYLGQGVVLIFYRGHWCPFCVSHMEDITTVLPELQAMGVQVIAISPDDAADVKAMANRVDNAYVFLSDPSLEVAERYGIRRSSRLPHPAVVVVDGSGIVQWFYVGRDYKKRPSATQIMKVINRINLSTQ